MDGNRILFIDAARTYAILLALGTHALYGFGVPDAGDWIMNYPFLTSMAAPMFIFMFGAMMEIVYSKKAAREGTASVDRRLFKRAYQCYLAGAFVSLGALIGGLVDLETFFGALLLVDRSRYANILVMYAGALLLMPLVIRLRIQYGMRGMGGLLVFALIAVYLISFTKGEDLGYWGVLISRILGAGNEENISVLATLIFISLGMMSGKYALQGKALYLFAALSGGLCLSASLLIWGVDSAASLKSMLTEYAYGRLRSEGNIIYFLMGSFYSLMALSLIKLAVENIPRTHSALDLLSPLGKSSLLAFTIGNIILNVWHPIGKGALPPTSALLVFFAILWIACRFTEKVPTYRFWFRLFNPNVGTFKAIQRLGLSSATREV